MPNTKPPRAKGSRLRHRKKIFAKKWCDSTPSPPLSHVRSRFPVKNFRLRPLGIFKEHVKCLARFYHGPPSILARPIRLPDPPFPICHSHHLFSSTPAAACTRDGKKHMAREHMRSSTQHSSSASCDVLTSPWIASCARVPRHGHGCPRRQVPRRER